jgi:hypothetical protein
MSNGKGQSPNFEIKAKAEFEVEAIKIKFWTLALFLVFI